jgi:hypothetical protein
MVGLSMTNRYRNATSGAKKTLNCEKAGADVQVAAHGGHGVPTLR